MIIDFHSHALSERFIAQLERAPVAGFKGEKQADGLMAIHRATDDSKGTLDPNLFDTQRRLESLRLRNVGLQLFAPPPFLTSWVGGAPNVELVRALHDMEQDVVSDAEGLMEPIAILALGQPEVAPAELRRAVDQYGFRAVAMPTTVGGRPLDDPAFAPLFQLIERLGLTMFMHPSPSVRSDRFGMFGIQVLVGFPFETTLAVTRLIFSGVFERHPNLKVVLAHSGGDLAFLAGRLDAAYEAAGWEADPYFRKNISQPPSAYLKRLFYDTCALSEESNRFVIDTMGVKQVIFGTDYPFDIGDAEGRRSVPVIDRLPAAERERIYRGNAHGLLTGTPI
jgi:aminocarboxymuconate-semialdehyde decarboxylase